MVITRVIIRVTPFRALISLLITYLLSPLPLQEWATSAWKKLRPAWQPTRTAKPCFGSSVTPACNIAVRKATLRVSRIKVPQKTIKRQTLLEEGKEMNRKKQELEARPKRDAA